MIEQPPTGLNNGRVMTWRDAVAGRADVVSRFADGRPVFGVDARGRVVLANEAGAVFSGGAVRFGQAVPPGGTVAGLVARFADHASASAETFTRTRAVIGLRASMLGLKLSKVDVAPLGPLTIVTFAEGVAPLPGEGGLIGDPLDVGQPILDDAGPSTNVDAASRPDPVPQPQPQPQPLLQAGDRDLGVEETSATMEDPFSDASFATFSPVSFDLDDWTLAPPRSVEVEPIESDPPPSEDVVLADDLDVNPAPGDIVDGSLDGVAAHPVVDGETAPARDARVSAMPSHDEPLDGVMALAALDGVAPAEAARLSHATDIATDTGTDMETVDELDRLDGVAFDSVEAAVESAREPSEAQDADESIAEASAVAPAGPAYRGRSEPHRFVWQMDGSRRFTLVSRELADAVGGHGEALTGRSWIEVADDLRLDPDGRVEAALARRDTWSGLTVLWPVANAPVRVPVDLAALPSFGRNRSFDGYRGFGVCRTADWVPDADAGRGAPAVAEPSLESAPSFAADGNGAALVVDAPEMAPEMASESAPDMASAIDLETAPASAPVMALETADDGMVVAATSDDPSAVATLAPAHETVPNAADAIVDAIDAQQDTVVEAETVASAAPDDETRSGDEDPLARRLGEDLHDAAHSAFDDTGEMLDDAGALDAAVPAPLMAVVDPDAFISTEGTALPPDVAAATQEPPARLIDVPLDGGGLGDAVAELSDYVDAGAGAGPTFEDAAANEPIDADAIGLPTWHEATAPSPDAVPTQATEPGDELSDRPSDVIAHAEETEATAADGAMAAETPVEAALILQDVESAGDPNGDERAALDLIDTGLDADERFGVMAPVVEAAAVIEAPANLTTAIAADKATPRADRASLSEIAAALNQEMRAREAEALREEDQRTPDEDATAPHGSGAGERVGEAPVAFVAPPRPDNVIAAPIGPGAKVVTLPAGPRSNERVAERSPLSPPERDAFRQIARVLGARMEDEPVAAPRASILDAEASSTIEPAASEVFAETADALGQDALVPVVTDRLVGSLGETAESEARFVAARALTDLSIDNDEAAFVADGAVEALSAKVDPDQRSLMGALGDAVHEPAAGSVAFEVDNGLDAGALDGDAMEASRFDEGADAGLIQARLDDMVGEDGSSISIDDEPLETEPTSLLDTAPGAEASDDDGFEDGRTGFDRAAPDTAPVASPDRTAPAAALLDPSNDIVPRRAAASEQPVLEEFPMAVAVVQGQDIPFANQAFLDLLGYGSLDDLNAAGGLEALFAGPHALKGWTGDASIRPLPAITRDGAVVPVCVRIAKTRWADAPALVMAMETAERAAAAVSAPPTPVAAEADPIAASLVSGMGAEPRDTDELDPRARVAELEAVLDTATDGVAILDAEGKVVSMNRAGQALFGADAASLEGRKLADLLAPESRRAAHDYLDGLARNGVQSLLNDGREVIALEAGGGLVPLFMTIGRLGEGRARAFCAVMRDITQWKKAEEELTAAKKHAELASLHKSDFLAKISHEIRTPLNAIMGFAEVMIDERFGPIGTERYKEYLKDIRTSGAHIMSLVNDLLDLSKIEAGKLDLKFEAVELNAILRECVALMQPQANRERIIIRASLPTQVPPIVADSRSIRQIMLNLLSNAVKFTPAGGQVIVSTALEDQGQVALRVRDTGIGMTETEVTQALEPFRQVHTAKSGAAGTGLGLPLTKALVEANRAAFAIRSTPGQGTLVEIVFPSTRVLAS